MLFKDLPLHHRFSRFQGKEPIKYVKLLPIAGTNACIIREASFGEVLHDCLTWVPDDEEIIQISE